MTVTDMYGEAMENDMWRDNNNNNYYYYDDDVSLAATEVYDDETFVCCSVWKWWNLYQSWQLTIILNT
jgi:hypothetical protein